MTEDRERITNADDDEDDDDDDDVPQLSSNALLALQEFLQERQAQETLELGDDDDDENRNDDGEPQPQQEQQQQQQLRHVSEDWQLSQFWYTESTASALALEALSAAGPSGRIACVSCPTLYKAIVDALRKNPSTEAEAADASASDDGGSSVSSTLPRAIVLEFDRRFAKWGRDFVFYDYQDPSIPELPVDWRNSFDVVVCDPPFLNEECAAATWKAAVETLGKRRMVVGGGGGDNSNSEDKASTNSKACKVIFCTGEIMEETLVALSGGNLKKSETFFPEHASKLSNPFVLMTDYEMTML